MNEEGKKLPVNIISLKDNKINNPDSLTKSAAYFKTYTLRDIGEIDQMADSCIIHIDTDSNGYIIKNNSIKSVELQSLESTLNNYGYKNYSNTLAKDIMNLVSLTDDSIKSVGKPLNLTDEDMSNPLFDKYYIYSLGNPPSTITYAQYTNAILENEDAVEYIQKKHSDEIKETSGIENIIPHKPIVVEAYINGITNAGKYNTLFVSKNGKLYHLNFQKSLLPSDQSIPIAISMSDETGNESATNPDFFTYGEVHQAISGTNIINDIIVSVDKFFPINKKITIPSELVGLNNLNIPNHKMFGSISSSSGLNNMVDLVETELLFLSSENISEIDIADKIMTSGTNIPSGEFEVINAKTSIICTHRFLGCTTDDVFRTDTKIKEFHEKFRGALTSYAVEKCGHLAANNKDNMFSLQYDNQCRGSKLTGLPELEHVLNKHKREYKFVDNIDVANSTDETNKLSITGDKRCIINMAEGGATAGAVWTNAIYEIANRNCYTYVSVSLRLDEKYGLYLERRTLSNNDSDNYNSSDDTIDRVLIWDIRKYDINSKEDLADNPDWHSRDVRFPDGEIKHNEFISIGQVMYNIEPRKTMKLYIDRLGHIRILLSINPCSRNAEKILKMMREQYFGGGGQYPIISSLNYGDDGKKINGSIYNPDYYNGFIKLHKKTTNATLGVQDRDIVLRLNIDNPSSSLNPFNKKKTIYYKLKPEELETDCRNFIHDEMAMMPPNLSLYITDKENTSLNALGPSTTITNGTDIRDACLDKCRDTSDCDFAVIQGQSCNLYSRETSQYLINKNDSIASLTDNHDVYRKVCMPNTNTSSGTSMAKAGFVSDIGGPMNAVPGENFRILNHPTIVNQFHKEVSENIEELSDKETIEYTEVDKIATIIKTNDSDINLENIPKYGNNEPATIKRFIKDFPLPKFPLADINSPDDVIIRYYTNIQSRLRAEATNKMNTDSLKKTASNQQLINSTTKVINNILQQQQSGFANMNIPEYTEVADREKIDSDTRHLDGLLREIRKSINCPYSQPIPDSNSDSDSWTDNIFSPEYIALIIIAISLIYILYKMHSRR